MLQGKDFFKERLVRVLYWEVFDYVFDSNDNR